MSDTDLELNAFGRVSHYTFSLRAENGFCRLRIRFLTADADLSAEGRRRSLRYLADVLEQTIENSLKADNLKKKPSAGPDDQMHPASNPPVAPEAEPSAKCRELQHTQRRRRRYSPLLRLPRHPKHQPQDRMVRPVQARPAASGLKMN